MGNNPLEELAATTLAASLKLRFDICTCEICRARMLTLTLAELPPGTRPDDQRQVTYACARAVESVGEKPPHELKEDKKENYLLLVKKILRDRNLDLRHYHTELLKRRLALRLNATKLDSYLLYMRQLDKDPQEYDRLFATLCINVSEFFRDPPVWVTLRYLVDAVIQKKLASADRRLRIWSAGCANGEEAYSLAIVTREATRHIAHNLRIQIFATDIDKTCLTACAKAEYPKISIANVDASLAERYFSRGRDTVTVEEEIRRMVEFSYLDLTSSELIRDTDLIVCRNVFIYFDHSLQKSILTNFCESLLPGGFVVLGKTEILPGESSCLYEEVDGNARIYRKK